MGSGEIIKGMRSDPIEYLRICLYYQKNTCSPILSSLLPEFSKAKSLAA